MALPHLIQAANDASAAVQAIPAPTTEPLHKSGGGGTSDGMDPWQQTVETRLGQLHADIRDVGKKVDAHLFWTIGGFFTVLASLAGGFLWLADKLP